MEEIFVRQNIRDVCLLQWFGTCLGTRDQGPSVQDRRDNMFAERLWPSVKYEEVHLNGRESMDHAKQRPISFMLILLKTYYVIARNCKQIHF